jgi:hypothetical protein
VCCPPRSERDARRVQRWLWACHAVHSSAMTGARLAALAAASATRALSALLGARWPKWRPGGIGTIFHCPVNSSETPRRRYPAAKKKAPIVVPEGAFGGGCGGCGGRGAARGPDQRFMRGFVPLPHLDRLPTVPRLDAAPVQLVCNALQRRQNAAPPRANPSKTRQCRDSERGLERPHSPMTFTHLKEGRPRTYAGGFSGTLGRIRNHRRIHCQGRKRQSPRPLLLVGRPKIGASHMGRGEVLGGEVCQDAERYGAAHAAISALIRCTVPVPTRLIEPRRAARRMK